MPTISYPDNSGNKFDYTSIELDIKGTKFVGVKEISYSDEMEPGEVYGTYAHSIGVTRGQYKAEGSMTIFKEELPNLIALLSDSEGKGWMETQFVASVSYSEPGKTLQTDVLYGCRIKKVEDSHSAGGDALEVKIDLRVQRIERNGKIGMSKVLR
jgi:hypothetical protein